MATLMSGQGELPLSPTKTGSPASGSGGAPHAEVSPELKPSLKILVGVACGTPSRASEVSRSSLSMVSTPATASAPQVSGSNRIGRVKSASGPRISGKLTLAGRTKSELSTEMSSMVRSQLP